MIGPPAHYDEERLPLPSSGSWENGVNQLWEQVIKPSGFKAGGDCLIAVFLRFAFASLLKAFAEVLT